MKQGPEAEEKEHTLRWHVAADHSDHALLVSTFIEGYIEIKYRGFGAKKSRSVLDKCSELGFGFDLLVHSLLGSLCTSVVPLDIALHIASVFLLEGQKSLFRFAYAVIKCNKEWLLNLTSSHELVKRLKEQSKDIKFDDFLRFTYLKNWSTRGYVSGLGAQVKYL
jgi:hypothetical protein